MKTLILAFFALLASLAPSLGEPALVAPVAQTISREDLRKTVAHIQKLAREQQAELDAAKLENQNIQSQLEISRVTQISAQSSADILQVEVNEITNDRNNQAQLKDSALTEASKFKDLYHVANGKLWKYRAFAICLFSLAVIWLLFKFTSLGTVVRNLI